jgi:hypothetical protein
MKKSININNFEGTSKTIWTSGSVLEALRKEGYQNATIQGDKFGSLGSGRGSFWVSQGI